MSGGRVRRRVPLDECGLPPHDERMIRVRFVGTILAMLTLLACGGCTSNDQKPVITYSTLPTREVQTVYPLEFAHVHATCQHILRDTFGYDSVNSNKDDTTGQGRIDATGERGSSVRIETLRSRDLESTSVTALAVQPGATEPSAERAREILQRIEKALWPAGM